MQDALRKESRQVAEFKTLLEDFCKMVHAEGIQLTPYEGTGPGHFSRLPEDKQFGLLALFRKYVELCSEVIAEGTSLRDDRVLVWRMMQKLKLHPPSDLMEQIRDDEVIEIYNSDFVQVFRNMRFFEICSYSLDDLLCRPFWELVNREDSVTALVVKEATVLLNGSVAGLYYFDIPEHSLFEIDSPGRNVMIVQQRVGATLRDLAGAPAALIATLRVASCVRTAGVSNPDKP